MGTRVIPVPKEAPSGASDIGEGHINIFPIMYSSITQGTWVLSTQTNLFTNTRIQNNAEAINDRINYKVFLAAGTYTFTLIGSKGNDRGILDLLLDSVSKGTIDLYNSVDVLNFQGSITGIVIPADALIEVGIKVPSKNASSSNYKITLCMLTFFRTV